MRRHPELKSELNKYGINVLKKINREIARLNRMKKVTPESILGRNLQIRLNTGLSKSQDSAKIVRGINSVLKISECEAVTLESQHLNDFMIKFMKFVHDPRKISR